MAKIEQSLQPLLDEERRKPTTQKAQWRLIVYFVSQHRPTSVWSNDVPVTPATKGTFDLNVFKNTRRLINGVLRNPHALEGPKYYTLDNGARSNVKNVCLLNYSHALPRRH